MLLCGGPGTVVHVACRKGDDPCGSHLSWLLGYLQPTRKELGVCSVSQGEGVQ